MFPLKPTGVVPYVHTPQEGATVGALARLFQAFDKLDATINVKTDFEAAGDGTTPDDLALSNASAYAGDHPRVVPPGVYRVSANLTLNGSWLFLPGASFTVDTGVVVTFTGEVAAGRHQIFEGAGSVRFTDACRVDAWVDWWGAAHGTDSTAAFQAAINALRYLQVGDALTRRLRVGNGVYEISDELVATTPIVIEGETSYGTRLLLAASFPSGGSLIRFEHEVGLLDVEENHAPGYGLRHIGLDGRKRETAANAIRLSYVDRSAFDDVLIRWFKGSALLCWDSVRESTFIGIKTWMCGSPTAPTVDLFDRGTSGDGHNLLKFVGCNFALNVGDQLRAGSDGGVIVRNNYFTNCVFHGLNEPYDAYTDNLWYPGEAPAVGDNGQSRHRILIENARGIFFGSGCRILHFGRGQPVFHLIQSALGASSINSASVDQASIYQVGYSPRSVTSVDTATDELDFTLVAYSVSMTGSHYMSTGTRVRLTGTNLPSPLVSATDYYVIRTSALRVKLATSRANAFAGTAIDINTTGSGAISMTPQDSGIESVDAVGNSVSIPGHRYATGARVRIASDGGTVPGGLTAGTDYFLIRANADTLRFATSRANADAGTGIVLSDAGTGSLYIVPQHFICHLEHGTFAYAAENMIDVSPNRALVRQQVGSTVLVAAPSNYLGTATPLVERSDGGGHTYEMQGSPAIPNGASVYGRKVDGTAVQMAKLSTADVAQLGNASNVTGVNTQVFGKTIVDLVVDNNVNLRGQAAADGETGILLRRNVGGTFSLVRVSMGAADSAGAGFKVLRVPN
jgi:hypothetical protein